jgi:hypothetical protein
LHRQRVHSMPRPLSPGALAASAGYHLAQANVTTNANYERHIGTPLMLRKQAYSLQMLLVANEPLPPKRLAHAMLVELLGKLAGRRVAG